MNQTNKPKRTYKWKRKTTSKTNFKCKAHLVYLDLSSNYFFVMVTASLFAQEDLHMKLTVGQVKRRQGEECYNLYKQIQTNLLVPVDVWESHTEREHHRFSFQSLLHHLTQKPLAHPKSQAEVVLKSDGQEFIHMEIWRERCVFLKWSKKMVVFHQGVFHQGGLS